MAARSFLSASILLCCLTGACYGVTLSSIQKTLLVEGSPKSGDVLKAAEDQITVTWSLNQTLAAGIDSSYKTVKIKLCYAPASQVDRPWRKTVDDLAKDKTCQHMIAAKPYAAGNNSVTWTVAKDVPTSYYFIRAYVYDAAGDEVGYGQTTDVKKTANVFEVQAISGRHASIDIASACFSAFSVLSLFGFFFLEKRKARASQQK